MTWNWQSPDWPNFRYAAAELANFEERFLRQSGFFAGSAAHVKKEDRELLTIQILADEAHQTSEIEGENLNRDSLQSSLRRHFGIDTDHRRVPPAEAGIAEMMMDLYLHHAEPITHRRLLQWHRSLCLGRRDLRDVGCYRRAGDPMQVVSGPVHDPKVHFEAPPAAAVDTEMERFLEWLHRTGPSGCAPLPMLTRAGIAHLYFVTIHPFEDGNGRIARAIAEKVLAEGLGHAVLIPLSQAFNGQRKAYYAELERTNRSLEITPWLRYFGETVIEAQALAQTLMEFVIAKSRFFERHRGAFNERQEKAILRLFREGPKGFAGGLSAENYLRITAASRPTATRDLQDLVHKGALTRTGQLKGTRYHLKLEL